MAVAETLLSSEYILEIEFESGSVAGGKSDDKMMIFDGGKASYLYIIL
jgi:hypothetical protein